MNSPGVYVVGQKHTIEILTDPNDEELVLARCRGAQTSFQHGKNWCEWNERYDSREDALEYCRDHADRLRAK